VIGPFLAGTEFRIETLAALDVPRCRAEQEGCGRRDEGPAEQ
jgi:hypothetical protein